MKNTNAFSQKQSKSKPQWEHLSPLKTWGIILVCFCFLFLRCTGYFHIGRNDQNWVQKSHLHWTVRGEKGNSHELIYRRLNWASIIGKYVLTLFLFGSSINEASFRTSKGDQPFLSLGRVHSFHIKMLLSWYDELQPSIVSWVNWVQTQTNTVNTWFEFFPIYTVKSINRASKQLDIL